MPDSGMTVSSAADAEKAAWGPPAFLANLILY